MSVGGWVLVGLVTWLVVSVALGLVVARFLRSVGEHDEQRPVTEESGSVDAPADAQPDETVPEPRDGDHDEVERARSRRRRSG